MPSDESSWFRDYTEEFELETCVPRTYRLISPRSVTMISDMVSIDDLRLTNAAVPKSLAGKEVRSYRTWQAPHVFSITFFSESYHVER